MSKIYNLFPTTVFESNIGVNKKEKDFLLNENYDVVKQNDTKNGLTSLDKHILDNTKYSSLKQKILKEINNYLYNIFQINKTINFYISSSWSIIHEKDDMAVSHYHVNSFVSGVYYFKTPKNCGNILFQRNRFTNNLFSSSYSLPLNMVNEYNTYEHSVEVEEGKLLLFPSHLLHTTEKNVSDEPRGSLAFNIFFEGKLGNENDFDTLILKRGS
tara:strand:+ start:44 stop:685 length:642 start_codon:yes stop_codon:yes gene_type:complete